MKSVLWMAPGQELHSGMRKDSGMDVPLEAIRLRSLRAEGRGLGLSWGTDGGVWAPGGTRPPTY